MNGSSSELIMNGWYWQYSDFAEQDPKREERNNGIDHHYYQRQRDGEYPHCDDGVRHDGGWDWWGREGC